MFEFPDRRSFPAQFCSRCIHVAGFGKESCLYVMRNSGWSIAPQENAVMSSACPFHSSQTMRPQTFFATLRLSMAVFSAPQCLCLAVALCNSRPWPATIPLSPEASTLLPSILKTPRSTPSGIRPILSIKEKRCVVTFRDHQPTGLENGQAVNHLHAPTAVVHALSALGAVTVGPEAGAAPGAQVGAQACLHTGGAATDAAGARAGGAPIGVNLTTILGAQLAVAASVSYVRTFPSGAVLPTHVKTRSTLSTARLPANLS